MSRYCIGGFDADECAITMTGVVCRATPPQAAANDSDSGVPDGTESISSATALAWPGPGPGDAFGSIAEPSRAGHSTAPHQHARLAACACACTCAWSVPPCSGVVHRSLPMVVSA
jgi:hypothetical protein